MFQAVRYKKTEVVRRVADSVVKEKDSLQNKVSVGALGHLGQREDALVSGQTHVGGVCDCHPVESVLCLTLTLDWPGPLV